MKHFKQFYLWTMSAKLYMGIYFAALVFLVGLVLACFGEKSIGLLQLLEIFGVSVFAAVTQALFLPDSTDFLRGIFFGRSVVWLLLVGCATGCAAHFGGWFGSLPGWCAWALGVVLMIGCVAMLVGQRFEQERDTIHLNEELGAYQKQRQ